MAFNFIDESNNNAFSKRLDSEKFSEGSGRPEVFNDTIFRIIKSTPIDALIRHGFDTVILESPFGLSAHNDWLETLYDYGIGGFLLYLMLHFSLIKKSFILIRKKSVYAPSFTASYMLFLFKTLTLHLILYPTYFIFLTA